MSTELINLSDDVQRLQGEGYTASLEGGCLVVRDIAYLDASGKVCEDGVLVDSYPRTDHTFRFSGIPHTKEGKELHIASRVDGLWNGFEICCQLSFKRNDGQGVVDYVNHFDKTTYYIQLIEFHARAVDPNIKGAKRYRPINTSKDDGIPFWYQDLNSVRAGINHVNEKVKNQKIAIVGLGGTGGYILDLVAKSHVNEIHIYDDDVFHVHNAFRVPGAVEEAVLNTPLEKASFLGGIYTRLHKGIKVHGYRVTAKVIEREFVGIDFVFVCIDGNEHKKSMVMKLVEKGIPFVDCGIAVHEVDGSLTGTIRITTVTSEKNDHLDQRIPYGASEDAYSSNIQIAELNALNAALAVVKWKRIFGFYHNHETEHNTTYMFNSNSLSNDEKN